MIKKKYNVAINYLYFEQEESSIYDIDTAIEDSKNGENDYSSDGINEFLNIQKVLLTSNLEKKIYTEDTRMIEEKIKQEEIAQQAERDKKREERNIYLAMKSAFDEITNYGENYIPEVHDNIVIQAASEKFGITANEADRIYINGEMGEY